MAALSRCYLTVYNAAQCAGWAWVLQRLATALIFSFPVYASVEQPLKIFQSLAVLEVLHAASGLVRASLPTTALQLASRLGVLWGIVACVPASQATPALVSMVAAWSLTEVPRYLYFTVAAAGGSPSFALTWLRYSTFFPLYPVGAASEFATVVAALPTIRATRMFSVDMPNRWNFAFDYCVFCIIVLVMYVPGLPFMYSHMIAQRRKYVGRARKGPAEKVEKSAKAA